MYFLYTTIGKAIWKWILQKPVNQRSSGSASLNFGEAQGTITDKDFIFKVSLVAKELKESRNSLKILDYKRRW